MNAAPGQLSWVQQVVGDFLAGLGQRTRERKPEHPHVVEVRAAGAWAALLPALLLSPAPRHAVT